MVHQNIQLGYITPSIQRKQPMDISYKTVQATGFSVCKEGDPDLVDKNFHHQNNFLMNTFSFSLTK